MFARLQKELAAQDVELVLIANDDPGKAHDFLSKKKLDVQSLFDGGRVVSTLYGANVLPKTLVIDHNGTVAKAIIGKTSEANLRLAIKSAQR